LLILAVNTLPFLLRIASVFSILSKSKHGEITLARFLRELFPSKAVSLLYPIAFFVCKAIMRMKANMLGFVLCAAVGVVHFSAFAYLSRGRAMAIKSLMSENRVENSKLKED
jgi:hypothetical protein